MKWPFNRSVVLLSDDARLLEFVAAELRELGCRVCAARDLDEVALLIRRGVIRRFALVRIGAAVISEAELREAVADRLPGWSIGDGDTDERESCEARSDRHFVN